MEEKEISFIEEMNLLFAKIKKSRQRHNAKVLAPQGLSGFHGMYLMTLYKFPDGLTQKEMSAAMEMDKAHTSRVARSLISRGFAEYKEEAEKSRNLHIVLTKKGKAIANEFIKDSEQLKARLQSVLTEDDKEILLKIMRKLSSSNIFEEDDDEAGLDHSLHGGHCPGNRGI